MEKVFKVIENYADVAEKELNDLLDKWEEVEICGSRFFIDALDHTWITAIVSLKGNKEDKEL